ncbi:MAG: SprT-like domain-containing protein [Gemmatimonadaceae bacterium]
MSQLALSFRATPQTADELLAVMRQLGLRQIERCSLTRNRHVMVSFGSGDLRLHEGYLGAPDDVLRAIVLFVESPTRRERVRARRQLLAFPIDTGPARRRRREATHPDDEAMAARLTATHALYNARFFGGRLRPLEVRVSRRMRRHLGHYSAATKAGDPAEIAVSRRHVRRHGWDEALQTLLHEMVHQWQDENGLRLDHGKAFRAKAREVGIPPSAVRRVDA